MDPRIFVLVVAVTLVGWVLLSRWWAPESRCVLISWSNGPEGGSPRDAAVVGGQPRQANFRSLDRNAADGGGI
jgi:hypothetical protein